MRIARVFPRKTNATPCDNLVFFDAPNLFPPDVDSVHVSVAFTWDFPRAESLEKAWRSIAPTTIGGPATGDRSGEFISGMYLRNGYTITSRGCPNRCWFCSVPLREGNEVRELPICDGWNVLDDNLLACSETHIRSVFAMLKRQKNRGILSGGLEPARLQKWHCDLIRESRIDRFYLAYDTPNDYEPLMDALSLLRSCGLITRHHGVLVYVLCGYPRDTTALAEIRLRSVLDSGATPMCMAWRDRNGIISDEWRRFQRIWARPSIIHCSHHIGDTNKMVEEES